MVRHTYRHTRAGVQSPAPQPHPGAAQPVQPRPLFVVQEHHARRLHYDFRLEVDGVLKSWAVPKGPSTDPAHKRLAVQVEDHPLAYATFAGTIPAGQYGAGTVAIWDQGTYANVLADQPIPQTVAEGIAAGHLEVALYGTKLQGQFALIRMHGTGRGQAQWLLIKRHDAFARPAPRARVHTRASGSVDAGTSSPRPSARAPARTPAHARRTSNLPQDDLTSRHTEKRRA